MDNESLEFLKRFLSCGTPSGYEDEGQLMWLNRLRGPGIQVGSDIMGNAWASVRNENAPIPPGCRRVMVVGHCDEVGLMVTNVDDDGFLHFKAIGGVDYDVLPGAKVRFLRSDTYGVVGRKPIHLAEEDDEQEKKKTKVRDLWIDIGAPSKEDAEILAPVGSVACLVSEPTMLCGRLLTCRGIDDKVGAFVAAEVVRRWKELSPLDGLLVYGVSTAQEEIGLCGAEVAAQSIKPDAAIVVDVGFATDTPDEDDAKSVGDVLLGKGPIVHRGAFVNRAVNKCVLDAAERLGIDIQVVAEPEDTGTDADAIRLHNAGIPTANVSIPTRYMHTPVEVCSLDDIDNAVRLVVAAVHRLSMVGSFKPFESE